MAITRIKVHGRKVWQARVAYRGLRKSTIRDTKEAARDAESTLLQELKAKFGQATQEAQARATVRMGFEAYMIRLDTQDHGPDVIARAVETARMVERLMPELLGRYVDEIGEPDLFDFRKKRNQTSVRALDLLERAETLKRDGNAAKADALEQQARDLQRKGTKPATINRDLRTIRAMLKLVRPDFKFPAGVFFDEAATRVRWLRPEEELIVFELMSSPFREIAKLAALTLMRLTEIRMLRREFIHLEQGVLFLPRTKTEPRAVVLSAEAQKILRVQMEKNQGSEWVFPNQDGQPYSRVHISRVFRKASRAAGLKDFHFHDLRHHGATMALNKGFTSTIVMKLGGWQREDMMRRYAAVTDPTLRAAAEAVAGNEPVSWARSDQGVGRMATPSGNVPARS